MWTPNKSEPFKKVNPTKSEPFKKVNPQKRLTTKTKKNELLNKCESKLPKKACPHPTKSEPLNKCEPQQSEPPNRVHPKNVNT